MTAKPNPDNSAPVAGASTVRRLMDAAFAEFNERGYHNTDTNKIARRADFAPQTFYRWFKDKREIFLAVYQGWVDAQYDLERGKPPLTDSDRIEIDLEHQRRFTRFRQSLRQLALEDPEVRRARAENRRGQIAYVRSWVAPKTLADDDIILFLLEYERLCDAVANEELADLGMSDNVLRARLNQLYADLRAKAAG